MATAFEAKEVVTIVGYEQNCECSHCGRELKVGVKLADFGGVFGSDCLARASEKQTVVIGGCKYVQKLSGEAIKERAIVSGKGAEYASRTRGWTLGGQVFKLTLKTDLKSI
jgi:hypothetical protein